MKFLKQIDLLASTKTVNIMGEKTYQTVIGGLLTIFTIVASGALSLYFFAQTSKKANDDRNERKY
jgi:hypothetical protein